VIKNQKPVKDAVKTFRKDYLDMRYTFAKDRFTGMLRSIMEAVLPYKKDFSAIFS